MVSASSNGARRSGVESMGCEGPRARAAKYRDANCEFVADQYKGGSMRPMIAAICLADVTNARVNELKSQIKNREP